MRIFTHRYSLSLWKSMQTFSSRDDYTLFSMSVDTLKNVEREKEWNVERQNRHRTKWMHFSWHFSLEKYKDFSCRWKSMPQSSMVWFEQKKRWKKTFQALLFTFSLSTNSCEIVSINSLKEMRKSNSSWHPLCFKRSLVKSHATGMKNSIKVNNFHQYLWKNKARIKKNEKIISNNRDKSCALYIHFTPRMAHSNVHVMLYSFLVASKLKMFRSSLAWRGRITRSVNFARPLPLYVVAHPYHASMGFSLYI